MQLYCHPIIKHQVNFIRCHAHGIMIPMSYFVHFLYPTELFSDLENMKPNNFNPKMLHSELALNERLLAIFFIKFYFHLFDLL